MHGLGNDFIIIDAINQSVHLTNEQVRFLADRHFGIGCDQLLLVEHSLLPNIDFKYRIFNADGGEVKQCGNGARCFARFVYDKGLTDKKTIAVETASGIIHPSLRQNTDVTVDMGIPSFEPQSIPFVNAEMAVSYSFVLNNGETVMFSALSMGNPHAVILVDDVEEADVSGLGIMLQSHAQFPEQVNAGFMQVLNENEIKLRVFERGAGETLACGTGACAAVVAGIQLGLLANQVKVFLKGGELNISWDGDQESVWMTGAATHVFDGEIEWPMINKS
mgnify:CR=1 FL=1